MSVHQFGEVDGHAVFEVTLRSAAASGLDLVFLVAGTAGVLGGIAALVLVRPTKTAKLSLDTAERRGPIGSRRPA